MLAGSFVCCTSLQKNSQGLRCQPHKARYGASSRSPWLASSGCRYRDSSSSFQRSAVCTSARALAVPQPELVSQPEAESVPQQEQAAVRSLAGLEVLAVDGRLSRSPTYRQFTRSSDYRHPAATQQLCHSSLTDRSIMHVRGCSCVLCHCVTRLLRAGHRNIALN